MIFRDGPTPIASRLGRFSRLKPRITAVMLKRPLCFAAALSAGAFSLTQCHRAENVTPSSRYSAPTRPEKAFKNALRNPLFSYPGIPEQCCRRNNPLTLFFSLDNDRNGNQTGTCVRRRKPPPKGKKKKTKSPKGRKEKERESREARHVSSLPDW